MSNLAEILRPLDPKGAQPLYQQLQRALREAIERKVLAPDDALPAERQIAAELEVSRIPVKDKQRILAQLDAPHINATTVYPSIQETAPTLHSGAMTLAKINRLRLACAPSVNTLIPIGLILFASSVRLTARADSNVRWTPVSRAGAAITAASGMPKRKHWFRANSA